MCLFVSTVEKEVTYVSGDGLNHQLWGLFCFVFEINYAKFSVSQ